MGKAKNFKFGTPIAINRSNRNQKCNSNIADVRIQKSEVVITHAVDWAILSKSGVNMVIAKRVLSLKPTSEVDLQLYIFKNRYDVITLPWVVPFGWTLVGRC